MSISCLKGTRPKPLGLKVAFTTPYDTSPGPSSSLNPDVKTSGDTASTGLTVEEWESLAQGFEA